MAGNPIAIHQEQASAWILFLERFPGDRSASWEADCVQGLIFAAVDLYESGRILFLRRVDRSEQSRSVSDSNRKLPKLSSVENLLNLSDVSESVFEAIECRRGASWKTAFFSRISRLVLNGFPSSFRRGTCSAANSQIIFRSYLMLSQSRFPTNRKSPMIQLLLLFLFVWSRDGVQLSRCSKNETVP